MIQLFSAVHGIQTTPNPARKLQRVSNELEAPDSVSSSPSGTGSEPRTGHAVLAHWSGHFRQGESEKMGQ